MSLTTHQHLEKIVEPRTIQILRTRAIGHNQCHHLFFPLLRPTYPLSPRGTQVRKNQPSMENQKGSRPSKRPGRPTGRRGNALVFPMPMSMCSIWNRQSAGAPLLLRRLPLPSRLPSSLSGDLFLVSIALDRLKDEARSPDGRTEPGWQDC